MDAKTDDLDKRTTPSSSGGSSAETVAPTASASSIDPEAALLSGLQKALGDVGIFNPDHTTVTMLRYAALLAPLQNSGPISTSRLFVGAVKAGLADPQSQSYPSLLAKALTNDPSLGATYSKFGSAPTEQPDVAIARLQSRWFSNNVLQILKNAESTRGDTLLSDAIVRAMFEYPSARVRSRIPMERVAEAVEKLRIGRSDPPDGGPRTLAAEIDTILAELKIPMTKRAQAILVRAAQYRESGAGIEVNDIVSAIYEAGGGALGAVRPTDPSAIFRGAITAAIAVERNPADFAPPAPPPFTEAADSSNPMHLDAEAKSFLLLALAKQRTVFLNSDVGTKGLIATLLTFQSKNSDRRILTSEHFRAIVAERMPDKLAQWVQALEFEAASVPKLNNDQPWSGEPRDRLGISNDALAIANVAAGASTSLPLAFGIFGDWGAGKTFFMRLIYEQIARVVNAKAKNDGFEHAIVQIQFNAWHYAETNLWASLVGHIFDELDRWMTRSAGETPSTADAILKRLATSRQLALETASELVQRRKEHAGASESLATAQRNLARAQDAAARAPDIAWRAAATAARDAIRNDPELQQQLGSVPAAFGVSGLLEDKAKLTAAFDSLQRSASAGNAALSALRATLGSRGTIVAAVAVLLIVPAFLFGLRYVLEGITGWAAFMDMGRGIETVGGLLTMTAVLVSKFGERLRALADRFADLRQRIDQAIRQATVDEVDRVAAAAEAVAQQAAAVEKARTVLQATGEQVAVALRDYAEETGGLRIRRFVRARAGDEGYGKHLGLVSTIRKDFEQLESLMLNEIPRPDLEDARKHHEARVEALIKDAGDALTEAEKGQLQETAKSLRDVEVPDTMTFRRIVLYIDDLDRCEPNKVVEVLQAVNMLLSFRLFVVMVAVDARWLSRSLETKYRDFFGTLASNGETDDGNGRSSWVENKGIRKATAADYLEKIFQVPYWVPPMSDRSSGALVGDLVAGDRMTEPDPLPPVPPPDPDKPLPPPPPPPPPPPEAEDDQAETLQPPSRAVGLTGEEIKALTALSPFVGGSPRRARRFVNVYRVAKASLGPTEREEARRRRISRSGHPACHCHRRPQCLWPLDCRRIVWYRRTLARRGDRFGDRSRRTQESRGSARGVPRVVRRSSRRR